MKLLFTLTSPLLLVILLTGCTSSGIQQQPESSPANTPAIADNNAAQLASFGLRTNTSKISIPFNEILSGGPGKDGIPAIDNPKFISIDNVDFLTDDSRGIYIDINGDKRFYTYDVLYWHEIINDEVGGVPIAVTFCPLCGSAIVFDRRVDGEQLSFGVSGLLWQSNLLMYDRQTESLWSQIEGKSVVGNYNNQKLAILSSQLLTFGKVKTIGNDIKILSTPKQFTRPYGNSPYGTYEEDTDFIFPVNELNDRFHPKEIFVATTVNGVSIGFQRSQLVSDKQAVITVGGKTVTATVKDDGTIDIMDEDNNQYPFYHAMWFSWANHNPDLVAWPE